MNQKKAEEVRHLYFKERKKQREIAEQFGITQGSVSRIVSGLSWAA
jgi:DNA-binding transcriptional regulator LsrR (DeoR family)